MEQTPSNMPAMTPGPKPGIAGWFSVWMDAVTKPSEQTFANMTDGPQATTQTALIWVFIAGTISAFFQGILRAIYAATGYVPRLPFPQLEQFQQFNQYYQNAGGGGFFRTLFVGICASPFAGLITVVFFAIGVGIIYLIAKMFGGAGTFNKLAYVIAAISFPITLVTSLLSLLSAVPFVGFCIGIISFGIAIYALVLQIMAVKGVNRFGWGAAIGSVLIPVFVLVFLCGCLIAGSIALLIPAIRNATQSLLIGNLM